MSLPFPPLAAPPAHHLNDPDWRLDAGEVLSNAGPAVIGVLYTLMNDYLLRFSARVLSGEASASVVVAAPHFVAMLRELDKEFRMIVREYELAAGIQDDVMHEGTVPDLAVIGHPDLFQSGQQQGERNA